MQKEMERFKSWMIGAMEFALTFVAVCALSNVTFAQSTKKSTWVGTSVMPLQGTKYRMGEREVDQPLPLPLDVFAEEGEWLVVGGGRVRKKEIVPLNKAADYYEKALKENPRNSWALCHRGILVGQDGDLDKALRDFNLAISSDPKNAEAYVMRGVLHATNEDYEKAIDDFSKAIHIRPDYADAYHQRGNCYFQDLDENEKALADFESSIKACPEFSEAFAGRGVVFHFMGRVNEALADYDRTLRLDPFHADSLTNRAVIRAACPDAQFRDGKKAIEDAKRACELTKNKDSEVLATLAAGYAEDGQFDEALKIQMQAISKAKGKERKELLKRAGLYGQKQPYRYEIPEF